MAGRESRHHFQQMPNYEATQQDNAHFADKIGLRRIILDEAGFDSLDILDAFCGRGHIWNELGKHYKINSYLPVDKNPKFPGTLKVELSAHTVQAFGPDSFNTIDLDAYDSRAWELLPHFLKGIKPMAIFITYGSVDPHTLSRFLAQAVGLPQAWRTEFYSAQLCFFCGEQFLRQQFTPRFKSVKRLKYQHTYGGERVRYYGLLLGEAKLKWACTTTSLASARSAALSSRRRQRWASARCATSASAIQPTSASLRSVSA